MLTVLLGAFGVLGWVTMAPSAAVAFLLLGGAALLHFRQPWPARAVAACAPVITLALLRLMTPLAGLPPWIDGRMSPMTAGGLLMAGLSLSLIALEPGRPRLGDAGGFLGSLVLTLGLVVTLGYVYGSPLLYGGGVLAMALTTALAFGCLGAALVGLAGPRRFPLGHLGHHMYRADEERRARETTEGQLRELDGRFRLLFERNPHPMWVYDRETLRFLAVNAAAVEHYGYSPDEFLAMTIEDIRPAAARRAVRESAAATGPGFSTAGIWQHRKRDGSIVAVEISSNDVAFGDRRGRLVLATDVTERSRLEEQLRQSQKMEAIGQLAGGVAHDFNNLLGVITGYAELLQKELGREDRRAGRVEQILKAAERAASLTHQLLAFGRRQVLQPKVLDANAAIEDIEKMLRRLIGEDVQVVTNLGANPGRVKADPGQLEQVIVNLAVNARDAMPHGGKLIIETANVELDESYCRLRSGVQPGPYVMIALSDTGEGMAPETMSRIFEPFFTTKEPGKGTGLGLATVYGIVKQSGGHVSVYSETGRGSTFKVYLPRTEEQVEEPAAASGGPPSKKGSETILLLEDDGELRGIIKEILEGGGYTALEAGSPDEALSLARSHGGRIDLLISDVVMPGMSGRDVASSLHEIRRQMRMLFMSGYTNEAIGHHGILATGDHFLEKPFTSKALLGKVREILDAVN